MVKSELNKYEKSLMGNLAIIKASFVAVVVLNLFLPLASVEDGTSWFWIGNLPLWGKAVSVILQGLVLIFHTIGLMACHYFLFTRQQIIMGPLLGVRFVQFLIMIYFWDINWFPFGLVLFLDVIFIVMLLMDKSSYEYTRESRARERDEDEDNKFEGNES